MTFGGDGHGSGLGATTNVSNYMFPGETDPAFPGQEWTEVTAGNPPADRRFLMSAGPVDLNPGDVYELDYAFVFARANTGGQGASVNLLSIYVNDIQAFYDGTLAIPCSVATNVNNQVVTQKGKLIKIIDVLGRQTKGKKNEPLFYIYDDGTVEKRIIIE